MGNLADISAGVTTLRIGIGAVLSRQTELKEILQRIEAGLNPQGSKLGKDQLSPDQIYILSDLLDALKSREMIRAIKAHRSLTGWGLKESKDVIDAFYRS